MKRMKNILSGHKILALCIAVLMLVSLTFASISIAKSGLEKEAEVKVVEESTSYCSYYKRRLYYTDATHTTQVGIRIWTCDGEYGGAGTVTQFWVQDECECFPEEGK